MAITSALIPTMIANFAFLPKHLILKAVGAKVEDKPLVSEDEEEEGAQDE